MSEPLDPVREWVRLLQGPLPPEFAPRPAEELMQLPAGRKPLPPPLAKGDNIVTMVCACGNLKKKADMPFRTGPVVGYTEHVCPGCTRDFKGLAIMVCAKCRVAVGRVQSCTDKRTGFSMRADHVYHLDKCPVCAPCQPGKIACTSRLIEKVIHERRIGLEPPPHTPRL